MPIGQFDELIKASDQGVGEDVETYQYAKEDEAGEE